MDALLRGAGGDRDPLASGAGNLAVARHREFQDHMRAIIAHFTEMAGVIARGLSRADADIDLDAGGAQLGVALPGHRRIGVLDRRHHARHPGRDQRVRAGRRAAVMRAWFQRDIERGAARLRAGLRQSFNFGMGTAAGLGPAAADNHAVLHQHGADRGVRPSIAEPTTAERQSELHESLVGRLGGSTAFRQLVLQQAEDHLRSSAARASSSADNSPSTASKSLASRKLR